jgi:hypothetical protein
LEFFFGRGNPTLKEVRRKYLEPNDEFYPGGAGGTKGGTEPVSSR